MPVLILAGDEEFELSRRVDKLKAEIVDPNWASFNFAKLINPDIQEIIDAAATLPFGPGKRMVLIDRCDLFTKKKSKGGDSEKSSMSEKALKQLLEDFEQALSAVASDTYLVFACPYNFDATLRTSKAAGKCAKIETFAKAKYWPGSSNPELETWLRREAHRHNATIDDDAIAYLLESAEANLRQISKEIEKAAIFVLPGKHITLEVVSTLSSHHSHVFSLLDHWANGRRKEAVTSLDELLSRQSGMPILATLHTTLAKWIQLKAMAADLVAALPGGRGIQRRELSINELSERLAAELKLKPGAVKMDLIRAKSLPADRLVKKRIELTRLENLVKTGQMSDHHALTVFLST